MANRITIMSLIAAALLAVDCLNAQDAVAATAVPAPDPAATVDSHHAEKTQRRVWKSDEAKRRMQGEGASASGSGSVSNGAAKLAGPAPWRLLVAFAVMGVMLYGLYRVLKKYGKRISGQESANLKVVSRISLDGKNSLVLVKFYEEELLLGVNSGGGLSLVAKCDQIEVAESEDSAGLPEAESFSRISMAELKNLKGEEVK